MTEQLIQKFWHRVIKEPADSKCWLWVGPTAKGYGHISVPKAIRPNRKLGTHVLSWMLHFGSVPDGLCVLHKCDIRNCVNPQHLWLGTRGDNNHDTFLKDRMNRGEDRPLAKLTCDQVLAIRERYSNREMGAHRLAKAYGVSKKAVQNIIHRKSWAWLARPTEGCGHHQPVAP